MPRALVSLDEISPQQAKLFAEAISLSTRARTPQQRTRLEEIYNQLDTRILRPDTITRLLTGGQSRFTNLCAAHKALNASPIHSIFLLFQLEVGLRLNTVFRAGREKVGPELWDTKILNLRSLHGLWLTADTLGQIFGNSLNLPADSFQRDHYYRKWYLESGGCEGCIIDRMISDPQTLYDLWAAAKSRIARNRRSRKPKIPRILQWLEIWIELLTGELQYNGCNDIARSFEISSESFADDLYVLRKNLRNDSRKSNHKDFSGLRHVKSADRARSKGTVSNNMARDQQQVHNVCRTACTGCACNNQAQRSDAESDQFDDNQDEDEILQQPPNNVYASYTALINTPFLPDMDAAAHQNVKTALHRSTLFRSGAPYSSDTRSSPAKPDVQHSHLQQKPAVMYGRNLDSGDHHYVGGATYSMSTITDENLKRTQKTSRKAQPVRQSEISKWTDMTVPCSETDIPIRPGRQVQGGSSVQVSQETMDNEAGCVTEDKHSNAVNLYKTWRSGSERQRSVNPYDVQTWMSSVSQPTTLPSKKTNIRCRESRKAPTSDGSKPAVQQDAHLLDREDAEQRRTRYSRSGKGEMEMPARVPQPSNRTSVHRAAAQTVDESQYSFHDLLHGHPLPSNDHDEQVTYPQENRLRSDRYEPDQPVRGDGRRKSSPKHVQHLQTTKLTDLPYVLRPYSTDSQQTTWTGMCRELAASNNRYTLGRAERPLEQYSENQETPQAKNNTSNAGRKLGGHKRHKHLSRVSQLESIPEKQFANSREDSGTP